MNDRIAGDGSQERGGVPARETSDARRVLLEAGRRLFASRGFKGTSVRALTAEAGVNLGAVTYHFGSKEALYHAVLEDCLGSVRKKISTVGELPISAMERAELVVRGLFHHLRQNPDLPRFFVQEVALGDELSPAVLDMIRTAAGTLTRILEEGQADGSVVPGDPVLQALSVLSQPIYLSVMPEVLRREVAKGAGLPLPSQSVEDHAVAFLKRGLLSQEEEKE
jgi:AcrR family transcriptional regulator